MFDLITIGDATLDTFLIVDDATLQCDVRREHCQLCLDYAEKIPIKETAQSVGGNAANVAAGASRLGLAAAIVTQLGDDLNGYAIHDALQEAGVDTGLVSLQPRATTRYSIVLSYRGERTILAYHAARRYRLPALPAARWLYYTSLGESFERLQARLAAYLKRHRTLKLAVNPGSYQLKKGREEFAKILPLTDLLIVNKQEAERLAGEKRTMRALCAAVRRLGPKTVVVTDSVRGSFASQGDDLYFLPSYPVKVVSKTGAGDAYASGFLRAYMSGSSLPEAMQWGTANAGGVIQQWGAQTGLLTEKDVRRMIARHPKITPTANYKE